MLMVHGTLNTQSTGKHRHQGACTLGTSQNALLLQQDCDALTDVAVVALLFPCILRKAVEYPDLMLARWRNGSASDSKSGGYRFDPCTGHFLSKEIRVFLLEGV